MSDVMNDENFCWENHAAQLLEAHPQPIDGYMKPVLFARPRLEFIDYTTIDRAMECYRGEAELVVEVCEFLRRQVDELFPDFIL